MTELKPTKLISSSSNVVIMTIIALIWLTLQVNGFSLLFAAFVAILWVEFFMSRFLLKNLTVKRKIQRNRAFIDQKIKIDYTIHNKSPIKLIVWFLPMVESASSASKIRKKKLILKPREEAKISSHIYFGKRGIKDVSKCLLSYPDPLGFFKHWITYEAPEEILVLPSLMEFENFPLRLRELLPGLKSDFKLMEDMTYMKGIREYSGDPLNKIHWKISAKMNSLYVKEFNYTAISRTHLYLDLNLSKEVFARDVWGRIREFYEEQAILAASSLIHWSAKIGHKIDLTVVGKKVLRSTGSFSNDWVKTVELLAISEGTNTGPELSDVLSTDVEKLTPATTVVLFSMYLTDSILPVLLKARARCSRVIVILMPYGFRDPRYKPARSYELLPIDMRDLKEKAAALEEEQIIVRILRDNQSLQEVVMEIEQQSV
ncbi:DUF58 domain-containing protein [Kosmotoga sp. DU53]|uniref:DUF58 domain-containing protein n=1 Tax=Kosmotoga sp. DU53 TaxID=1310160 RepID=UPI0007C45F07|nr:DUF58 domain-containing protein [Kosmotoga sp. DU53]MDK2953801.1 hypothetical protein [Kosmotoga sp.]OAA23666.1 hypothetical protein DU53_02130 [Kosmotoga sp. DU53]